MRHCALIFFAISLARIPATAADAENGAELFGKTIRKIEYLEVDTNRPLDRTRYDRIVGLKEGRDKLTQTGLKNAIQVLYDAGSVSDISISAEPDGDEIRLQFHLRLSTYFNRFQISKGVDLGGRSVVEAVGLPVGERFSFSKLEEARQLVLRLLLDQGFYEAVVATRWTRDGDSPRIDTFFDVQPGPRAIVRSLAVHGVPENVIPSIRERLGLEAGQKYRRDRFQKRLDALKKSLVGRGFLDVELSLNGDPDSYRAQDHSIALDVSIANFGQVRIVLDGFKIPKEEQRRLLPVLAGGGLRPELVDEGTTNLREYLEERGYPEAAVLLPDGTSPDPSGVRLVHYAIERGRRVLVSEVQFRGNRAFPEADLLKAMQMQPSRSWEKLAFSVFRIDSILQKSTYSVSKLDADVESLLSLYASAGYLHASIVPLPEFYQNGERVRLTFACAEGDPGKRQIDHDQRAASSRSPGNAGNGQDCGAGPHLQDESEKRQALLSGPDEA